MEKNVAIEASKRLIDTLKIASEVIDAFPEEDWGMWVREFEDKYDAKRVLDDASYILEKISEYFITVCKE